MRPEQNNDTVGKILESAPFPVIIARVRDGVLVYGNKRAATLLHFDPETARGSAALDFYKNPEDRARFLDALRSSGSLHDYEIELLDGDRTPYWALMSASFIHYEGEPAIIVGINNISAQKEVQRELDAYRLHLEDLVAHRTAQLETAMHEAQAASRAKSAFLSTISHEIRTPMNAIIGYAHLLRSGSLAPGQSDKLAKMTSAAEHLLRIINDILDISRIEIDEMTLESRDFDPAGLIREATRQIEADASAKGIALHAATAGLPRILRGDATRLARVLRNLAGNAVKFTDRGRVDIECRAEPLGPDRVTLRIEVRDTGIGIAPDVLAKLFTPFLQADGSTTRRYEGTGLGLAIARKLVELMAGRIGAESEPGIGSRFWFEVPVDNPQGWRP